MSPDKPHDSFTFSGESKERHAVTNLILSYAWHMDRREWLDFGQLFTDDATVTYRSHCAESSQAGQIETIGSARCGEIASFIASAQSKWKLTHHVMTNIDIQLQGDSAASHNYLLATHIPYDEKIIPRWEVGGVYQMRHVKSSNQWRINSLELDILWDRNGISRNLN
jgi:hypothetical protein